MIRKARVAGQFYPEEQKELLGAVKRFLTGRVEEKAIAIIAPHAGYVYSGGVAGAVYSAVTVPDAVVLIGPNHTGLGKMASIMTEGQWETPLGNVTINRALASAIRGSTGLFSEDATAHLMEHSLEVQLPFIHCRNKSASFVPITVMHGDFKECEEMGKGIASAITAYGKEVLIVASSDMNHYESDKITREKDRVAIDKALNLDAKGLLQVATSKGITMCGVIPAAISIVAAKILGAKEAQLVKYATSGDTSGDYEQVVGYAGMLFK
jgi:MEMO1 family protein